MSDSDSALPGKAVDEDLIDLLSEYIESDDCPPLFGAYLADVVLRGTNETKIINQIHWYLRNPEILEYGLGDEFMDAFKEYELYQLLRMHQTNPDLPRPRIPERYRPKTGEGRATEEEVREIMAEVEPNPPPVVGDEEEEEEEAEPVDYTIPAQKEIFGDLPSLAEALEYLASYRLPSPETADRERAAPFPVPEPDWSKDSTYRGVRQPPLPQRLQTIINFLSDEDVDRCIDWAPRFTEAARYVYWLCKKDAEGQLDAAGMATKLLFRDAVDKLITHHLFQQHHYGPTPLEIASPPTVPLRPRRLDWMGDTYSTPTPVVPSNNRLREILPRALQPREVAPVNTMLAENPGGRVHYEALVRDAKKWWDKESYRGRDDAADRDNLAYIEGQAFDLFSGREYVGWVRREPLTGEIVLPDQELQEPRGLDRDRPEVEWVRERGARHRDALATAGPTDQGRRAPRGPQAG